MSEKVTKVETVEEYLARGGKITKLDYIPPKDKSHTYSSPKSSATQLMTLEEGAFFYSEEATKEKPKKELNVDGIDLKQIPEHILISLGLQTKAAS